MQILLVEDYDDVANLVISALEEAGHFAERVVNGRDGLFLFKVIRL